MNKKKVIKRVIVTGIVIGLGVILHGLITAKPTESLTEDTDDISMYDDKEFYQLTHNEDGSLNEHAEDLI
jgi:hypothetical protein